MTNELKPCPYCQSVKNEWGTCSWHCVTCKNIMQKNCFVECNYKHKEDDDCERYPDALNTFDIGI